MKVAVASDVHTELHADGGRSFFATMPDADLAVLAGDIGDSKSVVRALRFALDRYAQVVFVPGNHEYWWGRLETTRRDLAALRWEIWRDGGRPWDRLHILDNRSVQIEGVRFVGTTLWTRKPVRAAELEAHRSDAGRIFEPAESLYHENRTALRFLEDTVQYGDVVVTHHLPSPRSSDPAYDGHPSNPFYICDVESLISERSPRLWIHGHTHRSCDYRIRHTRVLCNPFGLVGRDCNPDFDDDLVLEI